MVSAEISYSQPRFSWREALTIYTRPRVIGMMFLGFSAGLPYLLVFSTLTAWLRDDGVSRSAIGFFAWIGIIYSIKVLWAPVVDRLPLPWTVRFGQRRSWMLAGQLMIVIGLFTMPVVGSGDLWMLSLVALLVAFGSATQDIAIDAYRIEAVIDEYQGAMSATYIFGYRVALLVAGAGALYLAEFFNWMFAYQMMAAAGLVGVFTVLMIAEPDKQGQHDDAERVVSDQIGEGSWQRFVRWFVGAVVAPFLDFFRRNGRFALIILLFIALYKMSDIVMGIMANPFYLDMGYSKSEIASVAKVFGFAMSVIGSFVCGVLVVRYGIYRPLLFGAVAVALTNLLFAMLAGLRPEIVHLALVISADNLSGGIATTAFVAYLSSLTNRAYTATQYALFSSIMTFPGKFMSGFSGLVVDGAGYGVFFVVSAGLGLPAIVLVFVLMAHERKGVRVATETEPT